jgi:hypothetical protein
MPGGPGAGFAIVRLRRAAPASYGVIDSADSSTNTRRSHKAAEFPAPYVQNIVSQGLIWGSAVLGGSAPAGCRMVLRLLYLIVLRIFRLDRVGLKLMKIVDTLGLRPLRRSSCPAPHSTVRPSAASRSSAMSRRSPAMSR